MSMDERTIDEPGMRYIWQRGRYGWTLVTAQVVDYEAACTANRDRIEEWLRDELEPTRKPPFDLVHDRVGDRVGG